MIKASILSLVLASFTLSAQWNDWDHSYRRDPSSLPEPSAVPELAACVGGVIAFAAWRRRK